MGKKTSIYLTDDVAKAVAETGESPSTLIQRGLFVAPRLIEESGASGYDWTTWWYCDVPPKGAKFRVLKEQWRECPGGRPVREVYEVEVTHHTPTLTPGLT